MKKELDDIESLLQKGKYVRIAANCHKYTILYLIKILCKFRIIKRFKVQTTPIFNFSFIIDLPAHPDIFLFGCKTSKSDFLLQRYLHNFLKRDSIFFDIGSSIGFYSLFVSRIVGTEGMVYSIEPSEMAYAILTQNTRDKNNINTLHLAIGDHNKTCPIHEFPTRFNEYNSLFLDDFIKDSHWYPKNKPTQKEVQMRTIDALLDELQVIPGVVKIDVEGSEELLLKGMSKSIANHHPDLILRYWPNDRDNAKQKKIISELVHHGYSIYSLQDNVVISLAELSGYELEYVVLKKM